MTTHGTRRAAFDRLARASGAFAMVALDQREGLRTMIERERGRPATDKELASFKVTATAALSPHASAVLVDRLYGLEPVADARVLDAGCGLIVAADRLVQERGGPVTDTAFDDSIDLERVHELGAVALKLLVIWRPGEPPGRREEEIGRFLDCCRDAGLLAIVEAVVRPGPDGDDWDREAALVRAAEEVGRLSPDLYKGEVPMFGDGPAEAVEARCRTVTEALPCPWVVLSSGVAPDAYPGAVAAACRGGASGFLAGRAIWSTALARPDVEDALRTDSVARLRTLVGVVDENARPWTQAVPRV